MAALATHLHKALKRRTEHELEHLAHVKRQHAIRQAAAAANAAAAAAGSLPSSATSPAQTGGTS